MDQFVNMRQEQSRRTRFGGLKIDVAYFRMKIILVIFKLLGIAPWIIERKCPRIALWNDNVLQKLPQTQFAYSKLGCAHHVVLIVIVIACGVWVTVFSAFNEVNRVYQSQLSKIFDMGLIVSGYITVTIIRLILCIKQDTAVRLLNHFKTTIDSIACSTNIRNPEPNGPFFVLLFFTYASAWIIIILITHFHYEALLETFFCIISIDMTVSSFVMQYVIIVKLIEHQFRALNHAILDTSNYSGIRLSPSLILSDNPMRSVKILKILTFRQTHISLCEIANEISDFFSLPILFSIPYMAFTAIYAVYLSVILVILEEESNSPHLTINLLAWLIVDVLPIVMLAMGISETYSQVSKSAHAVHELLARASTSQIDKSELRQFSIEMYRQNVKFSAYGLFFLDCTLLYSIISTAITYLIILIKLQFVGNRLTIESDSTA